MRLRRPSAWLTAGRRGARPRGRGRAIATVPDLLLVDEPFAGLSGQEVQELSGVLESLRQHGMTLVVVDHNMRGLLSLIDRAFVIQFGAKIAEGSPEEIKNDPTVQEA